MNQLKSDYVKMGEEHYSPMIVGEHVKLICHIGFLTPPEAELWARQEIDDARKTGAIRDYWIPYRGGENGAKEYTRRRSHN